LFGPVVEWNRQVTGEEDELRKEGELEKGRQREREQDLHAVQPEVGTAQATGGGTLLFSKIKT
jgi:hypothetical protein